MKSKLEIDLEERFKPQMFTLRFKGNAINRFSYKSCESPMSDDFGKTVHFNGEAVAEKLTYTKSTGNEGETEVEFSALPVIVIE